MMVGLIAKNSDYKTPEVVISQENSLIRLYLEHTVQDNSPNWPTERHEALERVQKHVTKLILTLRNKAYEESLNLLKSIFPRKENNTQRHNTGLKGC